jgi:hypothetical protein
LILLDFFRQYETEALLCGGDELQAREEVQRLGERVGPYPRFRIVYLRSLAVLAAWDRHSEQAIGLPGERWQIQAVLGTLYEAGSEPAQARAAFGEAARIIQGLAEGIRDEVLRSRFLAGPQIQQVVQQAQSKTSQVPRDQA